MKYCSILGAHILSAPFTFPMIYGNLSAYMDSYFRFSCSAKCRDSDTSWFLPVCVMFICPGALVSKFLTDKMGLRLSGLVFVVINNVALFASAWTVHLSIAWTAVLLGGAMGLFQGISTVVSMQNLADWAPDYAALFISTSMAASTFLGMVQNQIITYIVNPGNLETDIVEESRTFFSQPQILEKVPTALIAVAAMTLGFQSLGYIMMSPPPKPSELSHTVKYRATANEMVAENKGEEDNTDRRELEYGAANDCKNGVKSCHSNDNSNSTTNQTSPDGASLDSKDNTNLEKLNNIEKDEGNQISFTTWEVLRKASFYAVFMFGVANVYAIFLSSNFYKQFALLYIKDDTYLTIVGTVILFIDAISRVAFGLILSRLYITTQDAMVLCLCVNCIVCVVWWFVPQVSAPWYMVHMIVLAFVQSPYGVFLPVACLQYFGPVHFSTNYGLMLSCRFIVGILTPVIVTPLLEVYGWFWLFTSAAILCAVTLVLVVCADLHPPRSSTL